jgi:Uma2 family endonuclease
MSIGAPPFIPVSPMSPDPGHRFTVDEYHKMIEVGTLTEDHAVELLEGWIVAKKPHSPPHDGTIGLAEESIRHRLPAGWRIRVQCAITTDDSEPEPDLAIVRGEPRSFLARHPGPGDIGTLIEVADLSLANDRGDKGRIYARAAIPIYWIINLVDNKVEVYTDPSGSHPQMGYRHRQDFDLQTSVPFVLDGKEITSIPVAEQLP